MITAIFTETKTTLTFKSSEDFNVEQMGKLQPVHLHRGRGESQVSVDPGVFMVLSSVDVACAADAPIHVRTTTTNNKDGGFPDPPLSYSAQGAAIREFFLAKSDRAPR